jgi:hypothetical protein
MIFITILPWTEHCEVLTRIAKSGVVYTPTSSRIMLRAAMNEDGQLVMCRSLG